MTLLLFGLGLLAVFLLGVLIIALAIKAKYGDQIASYPLYAVRDEIIDAVVFKGVPRDDPWVESLYAGLNTVLHNSHVVAGPRRWSLATKIGTYLGSHPEAGVRFPDFPRHQPPPKALEPVITRLLKALRQFVSQHQGMRLQLNAATQQRARIQREKARRLRQELESSLPRGLSAA